MASIAVINKVVVNKLVLYSTSACHLCDLAQELVQPWLERGWHLDVIDIADDDELFERYGLSIPVVRWAHRDLNWPFDQETLQRFLMGE